MSIRFTDMITAHRSSVERGDEQQRLTLEEDT